MINDSGILIFNTLDGTKRQMHPIERKTKLRRTVGEKFR